MLNSLDTANCDLLGNTHQHKVCLHRRQVQSRMELAGLWGLQPSACPLRQPLRNQVFKQANINGMVTGTASGAMSGTVNGTIKRRGAGAGDVAKKDGMVAKVDGLDVEEEEVAFGRGKRWSRR
mmetsp:Transcript_41895/g.90825  ORF Transcript_41895/g.90825 Transcript_41895/m.90825 type:complete len:123 (+) Transcript_41895:1503-1871(+)